MSIQIISRTRRDLLGRLGVIGAGLALHQALPGLADAAEPPKVLPVLKIETPTEQSLAPYGSMLGKPLRTGDGIVAFSSKNTDSWRQTLFNAGPGGEDEIVWVTYRNTDPVVDRLEQHHLTEQAVVPLTGPLIQVLALSGPDGQPDPATVKAFRLTPGVGVNMGRDVWHASRARNTTILMLTRGSTSVEILNRRKGGPLNETAMQSIPPMRLPAI